MPRGPKPTPITLTDDERAKLADWARRPTTWRPRRPNARSTEWPRAGTRRPTGGRLG